VTSAWLYARNVYEFPVSKAPQAMLWILKTMRINFIFYKARLLRLSIYLDMLKFFKIVFV